LLGATCPSGRILYQRGYSRAPEEQISHHPQTRDSHKVFHPDMSISIAAEQNSIPQ
jgi:hypothetical protein